MEQRGLLNWEHVSRSNAEPRLRNVYLQQMARAVAECLNLFNDVPKSVFQIGSEICVADRIGDEVVAAVLQGEVPADPHHIRFAQFFE